MMAKVSTSYSCVEFESSEQNHQISESAMRKLEQPEVRANLLNGLVKILDEEGERYFHSGVTSVDAYQRNEDGLRSDYLCDASGNGKMELGLQAPSGQNGYSPVLIFTFNLGQYTPEPWSSDLAKRVKEVAEIKHYIPGDWEETLSHRASV